MEVNKMNKCLSKFYVSVRRKDGSFYNLKTSLLSVRAALNHHLKSVSHRLTTKKFSSATPCTCLVEPIKGVIPT